MKNVPLISQQTKDVNRRPETNVLPKVHVRDKGTRQRLNTGALNHMYSMYGHTYSKSKDQPGKVANPARGRLNTEN